MTYSVDEYKLSQIGYTSMKFFKRSSKELFLEHSIDCTIVYSYSL